MSRTVVIRSGQKGPKGDTGPVESVNGQDGVVVLDAADVGAEAVGVAAGLVDALEGVVDALDFNDVGADQAGTSAAQIVIHSADTTNQHGIIDTALLLTTSTKLDDLAATDDNTDLNSTTSKHGLLRKLSNVSTEYLSGTGAWSVPAGSGGGGSGDLLAANNLSDLTSVPTARTNLGLGTAATTAAAAYEVAGAVSAHTISADPHGDRAYADAQIAAASATAFDFKASARVATTANITLSGAQTIDGVSVIATDRVLVKNQSTGSQNGIYVAAAGAWSRATDADISAEVVAGMAVPVDEGTVGAGILFILTTPNPITLATTALTFTPLSSGGDMLASNNLSELTSPSTARTNLGLTIGTNVQAFSAVLAATTASFLTADETKLDAIEVGATADMTAAEILTAIKTVDGAGSGLDADLLDGLSSAAFDVAGAAAAAQAAAIAASQPLDSDLTALAALTTTSYGRALLALADAAALRIAAGLGTMSTQAATAVAITGGTITGITDLAVADGGTGSSTAAGARTNLGLGTAAVAATGDFDPVGAASNAQAASQPVDADLTAIAALTTTAYGRAFLALADAAALGTLVDTAGAVMNADTTTAGMSFVIDEDSFASNLATKVPSQQSVAAYVAAEFVQSDDVRTIVVLTQAEYDALTPDANTQYNITDADSDVPSASETVEGTVELATNAEAVTGTDTTRAVTPAGVAAALSGGASVPDASETVKGKVELATNAETITGTDTARAVTPANIQAKVASTSAKGIVELATDGETTTGTDTTRAVTPSNVAAALAAWRLDDLNNAQDNTDLNVTTTAHGLMPKLGGGTTDYFRADGTWAAPVGAANIVSNGGTGATTAPQARINLGLEIGADIQQYNVGLAAIAGITNNGTQGSVIYRNATEWNQLTPGTAGKVLTTNGAAANPTWDVLPTATVGVSGIVELATTAETQTGSDTARAVTPAGGAATYQPLDTDLTAIAALTSAANKGLQSTGTGTWSLYDLTTAGKALLDDADASAQRTTLGLGTAALISSTAGGDLSGTLPSPTVAKINGIAVTGTPSVGDVPTATSASAATWQAPAGGGITNLGYTASPTNGIVTSDTGTDATVPLADATNAGLLTPANFSTLATPPWVTKALYDAHSIVYATSDNTPVALAVGASTVLGRKATGNIVALTGAEAGALIAIDETAAASDITTRNASTSVHGLLKKLSNVATEYMDGTGNWSVPAGGGGSTNGQAVLSPLILGG